MLATTKRWDVEELAIRATAASHERLLRQQRLQRNETHIGW
jgi:hypothetical protein